jgi:hypothetical protein
MQFIVFRGYGQCENECLTNLLEISTGVNYNTNLGYTHGSEDQFWKFTNASVNSYQSDCPKCAIVTRVNWPPIWAKLSWDVTGEVWGNRQPAPCSGLAGSRQPFTLEREFKVCLKNGTPVVATLNFPYMNSNDQISGIEIYDAAATLVYSNYTCYQSFNTLTDSFIMSNSGVYKIKFDILVHKSFGSGNLIEDEDAGMFFVLNGFISTDTNNVLYQNFHFGKNVGLCAPAYIPMPILDITGINCTNALTSPLTIAPFNTTLYTYSASPSATINGVGTFIATIGNTYTITCTDAFGCSTTTTKATGHIPNLAVSPNLQCVPQNTNGLLTITPFNTNLYTYQELTTSVSIVANPFPVLAGNAYTVQITDAIGCTNTVISKVGYTFQPDMFIPYPAINMCIDASSTTNLLVGTVLNNVSNLTYSFNGGAFTGSNLLTGVGVGTYTVVVKDAFGCTASATKTIFPNPVTDLTLKNMPGCVGNINPATNIEVVTNLGGPYTYLLNSGTYQTSNLLNVTQPGVYTVTIKDVNGCTKTNTTTIGDCNKCNYQVYHPSLFPTPPPITTALWVIDKSTNEINGFFPTGSPIIIDGTFTIYNNFDIINRPDIYFTDKAIIKLSSFNTPPITLNINNSTLQGCALWGGIIGGVSSTSINIENNSVITNMYKFPSSCNYCPYYGGINPGKSNLTVTNSLLKNNLWSIALIESKYNPNVSDCPQIQPLSNYATCKIENNTFTGTLNYTNSYNTSNLTAIYIQNAHAQIGDYNNGSSGNTFSNLECGVNIQGKCNVKLYNNKFINIHNSQFLYYSGVLRERDILNNSFWHYGSAINSSSWGNAPNNYNINCNNNGLHYLEVRNIGADPQGIFLNCDKAISNSGFNAFIENNNIVNCLVGINYYLNGIKIDNKIVNNSISNAQIGIYQGGALAPPSHFNLIGNSSLIENNYITTRNIGVYDPQLGYTYRTSIGIHIDVTYIYANISNTRFCKVNDNHINLNGKTGIGIKIANPIKHLSVENNIVSLNNTDPSSTIGYNIRDYYGYWVENSKQILLNNNITEGVNDQTFTTNYRRSVGMYMNQSPKCTLICNKAKYTRYGFLVWGDNSTPYKNILYNKCSGNYLPWLLQDAGSAFPSTFNNVGSIISSNGNNFVGNVNWLNPLGCKVFRISNIQPKHTIYSLQNVLTQAESLSSPPGNEYLVSTVSKLLIPDPCNDPQFFIAETDQSLSEATEAAVDIALDSLEYQYFPNTGRLINELNLYKELIEDTVLRNSDVALIAFYNDHINTNIDKICKVDRMLAALTDTDSVQMAISYTAISTLNNSISTGNSMETNEKEMNILQIKLIQQGMDSITEAEKEDITQLANTCVFEGGVAVYKARSMASLWQPDFVVDDRILCSGVGLGKNNDDIDLDTIVNNAFKKALDKRQAYYKNSKSVEVFPNPASDNITIKYQSTTDGVFELYNTLGQQVLKSILEKGKVQVTIPLQLPTGLYSYQCNFKNGQSHKTGLLEIKK